jgi:electron-transferring-flavoprotein dehydrogenase
MYYLGDNLLAIGVVIGLDYQNPYLNPYEEFQRFKSHPSVFPILEKSTRIAYGARTLIEGGIQSIPKLTFPGGLIIGDAAGFLNVAKIKGIHNAMKSGMVAAESLFPLLQSGETVECTAYPDNLKKSWLWEDLYKVRNIRPSLRWGLWAGLAYSAIDTYLFRGKAPWTLHHHLPDNESLKKAADCRKIEYPKHDNKVTFDLPSSVYLANVQYDEDQPYHLKLKDRHGVPITVNLDEYASPESRYCPAGVYEILRNEANVPRLMINGGNCIHCKACDIKDPTQNIKWTPSEGGSGPTYGMM